MVLDYRIFLLLAWQDAISPDRSGIGNVNVEKAGQDTCDQ